MRNRFIAPVVLVAVLLCAAPAPARQDATFSSRLAAIAAGDDSASRRQAITADLASSGVEFRLEEFPVPAAPTSAAQEAARSTPANGTNVLATVPARNASRLLLLSAHYDRVPAGRGVVDNGASCAALLGLMARFKSAPLERYSVTSAFFDLEERGLFGSRAYAEKVKSTGLPDAALNLDVLAYGDTLYGAATSAQGALALVLAEAAAEASIPLRMTDASRNQYPPSDHRSLIAAGIETVSLSLMDAAEVDAVINVLQATAGAAPPRVLTLIHTPADTLDKARAAEVEKVIAVLERAIRLLDQRAPQP